MLAKRLAAELLGTFAIVFAPCAYASHAESGLLGSALVSGLSVFAMVVAFGPVSGAHFNPAVTLGFALAKRFPWRHVAAYWAAQSFGSSLAALFGWCLFAKSFGAHVPSLLQSSSTHLALEATLGFMLMLVIMAVATNKRVSNALPGIAIGFMVLCGVLIGGPITGGSMNPARSFGPALFNSIAFSHLWIYAVGPCLGAALASVLFEWVRMDGADAVDAPSNW